MKVHTYRAVVIGSGCAGYNCADRLFEYGCRSVAVITEGRLMGTSRNTGSDKQTYYKLSLAGDAGDSVYDMAQTLFSGGAMDGKIALCEAANSAESFFRLVHLGVDFPTNEYGEYVGYRTDHDVHGRATSIGPYTSKRMTEVLEEAVISKGIPIYDNCQAIRILKGNGRVAGVLCIDTLTGEYIAFNTPHVILATGGPAGIYFDSVYPQSQTGSSALALQAGASFVNLSEWQFGLASVDFRWNVSGTYQQVLPRYFSVDAQGVEREFLKEAFPSSKEMLKNIFLKGYEWPFDVRKIYGSSYLDLLIYRESVVLGRSVYMDFTREPSGLEKGWGELDRVVYDYLKQSDALIPLPVERLRRMNEGAIELYASHGIDLTCRPLKVAVCAQHNNGGILVDTNWETDVPGLYACGEAAGTLGIFRPGGSALNSCQVGGMRAARHVAFLSKQMPFDDFNAVLQEAVGQEEEFRQETYADKAVLTVWRERCQKEMSAHFSFVRKEEEMRKSLCLLQAMESQFSVENKWNTPRELCFLYKNREIIQTAVLVAESMIKAAERYGSRGSSFVLTQGDFMERKPMPEHESGRCERLIVNRMGGCTNWKAEPVDPIPNRELWFERAWNAFLKERKGGRK